MNISLTPELEQFIRAKVESGMYHSSSEVVREALRMLSEKDKPRQARIKELTDAIQVGLDQIERGEVVSEQELMKYIQTRRAASEA